MNESLKAFKESIKAFKEATKSFQQLRMATEILTCKEDYMFQ